MFLFIYGLFIKKGLLLNDGVNINLEKQRNNNSKMWPVYVIK